MLNWESEKMTKRRKERNYPGLSISFPILNLDSDRLTYVQSLIRELSELKTDVITTGETGKRWAIGFGPTISLYDFGQYFLSVPQFLWLQNAKTGLDNPNIFFHFNSLFSLNIKSLKILWKVLNNSCPLKR